MKNVKIVEVGPRDGLQNESQIVPTQIKIELIKKLIDAGLKNIEIGAFVSPKWVPQMADTSQVVSAFKKEIRNGMPLSVLVPNALGMQKAVSEGLQEVAIFGAASESFSKKNINCSIEEGFQRFSEVIKIAKKNRMKVRGYLSTAFGCPYEGEVSESRILKLVERYIDLGVYEISIGDTIGVAVPKQVESLLKKVLRRVPRKKIAMHFHDTRGMAAANVAQSLSQGIRIFDSSVGGLGGCPYATGASGNVATEDLLYLLQRSGYSTFVDISKILEIQSWLHSQMKSKNISRVGKAGLPEWIRS